MSLNIHTINLTGVTPNDLQEYIRKELAGRGVVAPAISTSVYGSVLIVTTMVVPAEPQMRPQVSPVATPTGASKPAAITSLFAKGGPSKEVLEAAAKTRNLR